MDKMEEIDYRSVFTFAHNLYVNIRGVKNRGVEMVIYERVEGEEEEVVHMKKVGSALISPGQPNLIKKVSLSTVVENLRDRSRWDKPASQD